MDSGVEDPTYAFHMSGLANNAAEDVEQTLGLRGAYADEYIMTCYPPFADTSRL